MYLVSNWSQVYRLQAYLLYCASEMLNFLQIKGKTLHQQNYYWFCCDTRQSLTAAVRSNAQ